MEMAESSGGNGNGNGIGIRIPVVYYLSRNRHLEHPHFIEVSLSTPQDDDDDDADADADADAFFLRDFMERLNQVRGKGMAAMYSWSCKRSYKNGFVWHDLSEDDLILPANGNEYVLKGSELLHPSPSSSPPPVASRPNHTNKTPKPTNQTRPRHDRAANLSRPKLKEPSPSSSASPPPIPNKHSKPLSPLSLSSSLDEQQSPSSLSSGPHSPDQPDIKFHKSVPSADAWTQTEEETVTDSRGFPMDDNLNSAPTNNNRNSCCGKSEMLESLIRAEGRKFNQLRVLEENDDVVFSSGPRLSPASYLMHLITCGSISVKDYRHYEFIPIYRPSYIQPALPSPMYGAGSMRFLTQMEDKEYFSGSIVETKRHIDNTVGDRVPILKRSSSYNAERSCKSSEHWKDETETDDSSRSRCLPRTIKMIASPLSDCPRSSSADPDVRQTPPTGSRRNTTKAMPVVEPSRRKKEKLIKIEES